MRAARLPHYTLLALVAALPVTAALGPYLLPIPVAGINLFAYRLLSLLIIAISLVTAQRLTWTSVPVARGYLFLGSLWVLWATLASLWAPDLLRAFTELLALGVGFSTAFAILQLQRGSRRFTSALQKGWVLAFVAVGLIAVWELTTGNHLPSHKVEHTSAAALEGVAMATFNNPNNYAAFLILSFPFLYVSYRSTGLRIGKVFYAGLLLALPAFLVTTASRVAATGFAAQFVTCWILDRKGRRFLSLYSAAFVVAFGAMVVLYADQIRLVLKVVRVVGGGVDAGSSIMRRWNLTLSGIWFAFQSGGLGMGPGSFELLVRDGVSPFYTGDLHTPHNFFIEVLSQYGILVFSVFVGWLVFLARRLLDLRDTARHIDDSRMFQLATALLVGLVGYPFAALANSAYMLTSTHWMFWITVLVAVVGLGSRGGYLGDGAEWPRKPSADASRGSDGRPASRTT